MNENREPTEADVFEDGFEEQDMQDFFDNVAKRFCPECGTREELSGCQCSIR